MIRSYQKKTPLHPLDQNGLPNKPYRISCFYRNRTYP